MRPDNLPAPFGKYELLERIGTGGMADVFLARSFGVAGFEKRLVLKCIKPEHARDPRFVSWFIREAKIGVHLNHPNIVQVHELGKVGDTWYIAMEHLHGRDLNQIVRALRARGERLPAPVAARIISEVARGLAFAHTAPGLPDRVTLVHRDVSPHNIFVTFPGEVKLVDFGIARLLDTGRPAGDGEGLPLGGGKFAYMSPEQVSNQPIDPRSDIFSAGVVLWELLVGERLFQAEDPEEKLRRVREAVIPTPEERGVKVDPALWAVVHKALAREPDQRHDSAAALEEDLRAWLYELPRRPGRGTVSAALRDLFPEASVRQPSAPDLRRLAEDLQRLDRQEEPGTHTVSGSSVEPLPSVSLRAPEDERKRVAVMVVDVDGFTDISLVAEPEALFKRHLQMLRWLRRIVDEHGGTIQHVHDDQAFVLFGIPRTRPDDVERAVACALALQRLLPELHHQGVAIQLAVGLHVGDVTVGHAGNKVRYMARGDTTRLARRLSEHGDHGQVLVSDAVARATEGRFTTQRGPWLLGRGGRSPGSSYLVLGQRLASGPQRGPWLRRGDELERIRAALERLSEGAGAGLLLHGEVGSGKTRLVQEFTELARRGRTPVYVARVQAFSPPLAAARELALATLGLDATADPSVVVEHAPRLKQTGLATHDVEILGTLLGLRSQRLEPEDAWGALRRLLAALGRDEPIVVVIEDVHHLPVREQPFVAGLVQRLERTPILVLLTSTGAPPPALQGLDDVALGPLPRATQARLVAALLEARAVEPRLLDRIAASCEGNPLYVRELVKYLQERTLVQVDGGVARLIGDPGTSLPGTLAGLIASRIDALDPAAKGALQIAATLGDVFDVALLGEVVGVDDAVPLADELAAHGLVHRTEAGDTWTFASDLVREAALRGILGVQRRDYHRLVASALERRGGEPTAELAAHCGHAGRLLDAARYAGSGGQRLEESGELERARQAYRQGLAWLERPDALTEHQDERTRTEASLHLRLGVVSLALGDLRGGERALLLALETAEEAGLPAVEVRVQLELGRHHHRHGRLSRATAHLQSAWHLARLQSDPAVEIAVLRLLGQVAIEQGKPAEAVRRFEEVLQRCEGPAARGEALLRLAQVLARAGDLVAARRRLEEGLTLSAEAEDRSLEATLLGELGLVQVWSEEVDEAIQSFRRAAQAAEDLGAVRQAGDDHRWLGDAHLLRGDFTRAASSFQRGREIAEEAGWEGGVRLHDVHLTFLEGLRGDEAARARLDDVAAEATSKGEVDTALTARWLAARLLWAQGSAEDARSRLAPLLAEADHAHLGAVATAIARTLATVSSPTPTVTSGQR